MNAPFGLEQETFKTLLEQHRAQNKQKDSLERFRQKTWQHFLDIGLPSRQTEVYRYIKLRQLFAQPYDLAEESTWTDAQIEAWIYPECQQAVLVFINGHYMSQLSRTQAIPNKVVISTLQEATQTYGTFLNNHWNKMVKEETDPFVALNGALHGKGAFVYIPPKTVIETPIQILHLVDTAEQLQMLMPRISIFVGAQSDVRFVYRQKHLTTTGCFINQVTELTIEEEAHVKFTQILCDEPPLAWHLDALRATLKRASTLKTICVTEGSATVRTDYRVTLIGEKAEALLNGVCMLNGKSEAHTHVFIDHQAPGCRSYQLFKAALNEFSRASFEGKIMVRQAAQQTEAFQLNSNLLLSDHAHADSKPNLEIFADDVKASHGATVGQLDPEQLFYMKTRGFSNEEAKSLLVYGFCEQVIEMLTLPSLKEEMTQRARHYLKRGKDGSTL